jgi:hypothetical protein
MVRRKSFDTFHIFLSDFSLVTYFVCLNPFGKNHFCLEISLARGSKFVSVMSNIPGIPFGLGDEAQDGFQNYSCWTVTSLALGYSKLFKVL